MQKYKAPKSMQETIEILKVAVTVILVAESKEELEQAENNQNLHFGM